jgi:signal transduction histidine kinase/GAF domain-containing protein
MDLTDGKTQTPVGEESNILERVARLISSVRGVKPDYAHLAAELEPALPFDVFGIILLRHDRKAVRVTVCQRAGESWNARYHQHPLADSMAERLLHIHAPGELDRLANEAGGLEERETPEALLVQNFPEGVMGLPSECGDALYGHPQLRAVLITPLIAGGNMLGTLELGSTTIDVYDDLALQRLISAIASVLATAIESAQVGGNVAIQDRQREELKNVSTALTTAVDLPMILKRIVTGITNALHVGSAIVRFDRSQRCLCLEAQSSLDPIALQKVLDQKNILSEREIIGATLLRHQQRVSQDIEQDEQFPLSQDFARIMLVRSIYCYPLITGDYVYGALLLLSPEPGGFTPLKIDIFALFAGQATVAIHNGLLLQSAQERRHFQEVIEQLELAHQQSVFHNQSEVDEQDILKRLREETMNTFGVSLSSVLRFISDHLLTRSEGHLQEILRSFNSPALSEVQHTPADLPTSKDYTGSAAFLAHASDLERFSASTGREGTDILMQAADTALARTDFLKEISAALMRVLHIDEANPQAYEHLKRDLAEAWFIVRLDGTCVYLNRSAEVFCGIRPDASDTPAWNLWPEESQTLFSTFRPLSARSETTMPTLEEALATLLPRMRQLKDVLEYLREFTIFSSSVDYAAEESISRDPETLPLPAYLRCTIAIEPLPGQAIAVVNARERVRASLAAELQESHAAIASSYSRSRFNGSTSMQLDSSPSDHHYQFVRYALYNEYGHWFANAMHVHDVTEQVRDEKNKSVLLASVSHDLRTPLTTIKAAVTGLLQPGVVWDEETRREILEEIDIEADHLHTLVNALVEMSRIEMGALSLDKEWCDLVELVHNTLARSHRMLADFTIQSQLPSSVPLIHADYAQLERVIYNLLENATRHSPKQTEIHILVDTLMQKALPPGLPDAVSRAVRVRIIDQGPGVPEEEQERIFRSFYSLDAHGNGLGLAICRGIIEAHQGRIWVESGEQGGSCFVFVLPITS